MADTTIQSSKWEVLASDSEIEKTVDALKKNGIHALAAETGQEARKMVFEILPPGAEVMSMTSMTLEAIGISKEILEGNFESVRKKMMSLDRSTHGKEIKKLGVAPDWSIGSVHAVTHDGKIMIASNTGSQIAAHSYGAGKVIFVVGTQKIVRNQEEGFRRIYEHSLPLEEARSRKAYGVGSAVSKILIINREIVPGRITLIFVKEKVGF